MLLISLDRSFAFLASIIESMARMRERNIEGRVKILSTK